MRRSISGLLIVVLFAVEFAAAANPDKDAVYIGGTANIQQAKTSMLDVGDESVLRFADWQTSYSKITALGYGRHARYDWDHLMLPGLGFAPALLLKTLDHYLSVAYTDGDGKPQLAIFKVGPDSIETVLKTVESRSGKKIEYETAEPGKNKVSGNTPPLSADESSSRQRRKSTRTKKTPDVETSP